MAKKGLKNLFQQNTFKVIRISTENYYRQI